MKFFICIFAVMAHCLPAYSYTPVENSNKHSNTDSIFGGYPVRIEDRPFQVSVRLWNKHYCGGSILSARVIISAAHCIGPNTNVRSWKVVAGTILVSGVGGYTADVKKIIVHELYDPTSNNDVAIFFLSSPLPLNNQTMRAIELVQEEPQGGEISTVSGWGMTEEELNPEKLLEVKVPIVSRELCKQDYSYREITDAMICAGYRGVGGKDSCLGDSGGPLTVNGKLAGIVSFGRGCAHPQYPGVYSNVANLYLWIMEAIKDFDNQ